MELDVAFWRNKKVLLTGHTGFKGSWLALWLEQLQADVVGISLDPPTSPSLYEEAQVDSGIVSLRCDIRDLEELKTIFRKYQPEVVLHLAAQSLVRQSYVDPVETYSTNVMGTLNILEAIRSVNSVRSAVLVTTDKCYENNETQKSFRETDPMGGHDPYSSSKGCAELLIASHRNSFFSAAKTAIASARAGNVIGGGDWAKDRLIPDIIRSFEAGKTVEIRNPDAVRPWQHVLEPLHGYLQLAQALAMNGEMFSEAWNFGPLDTDALPVKAIVEQMVGLWGGTAKWSLVETPQPHEASFLKLDCAKARSRLGWEPKWKIDVALRKIVGWHRSLGRQEPARQLCLQQIAEYVSAT